EDMWVPVPPSAEAALAGATVIANLSGSPITIGRADDRKLMARSASARSQVAYVYAAAGEGESTTDLAWDGQTFIYECGDLLGETERFPQGPRATIADIDLDRIVGERRRMSTFDDNRRTHAERLEEYTNGPARLLFGVEAADADASAGTAGTDGTADVAKSVRDGGGASIPAPDGDGASIPAADGDGASIPAADSPREDGMVAPKPVREVSYDAWDRDEETRSIDRPATGPLRRKLDRFPFVPDDPARLAQDCYEAFSIQVAGLVRRLSAIGGERPGGTAPVLRLRRPGLHACAAGVRTGDGPAGPGPLRDPHLHDAGLRHQRAHPLQRGAALPRDRRELRDPRHPPRRHPDAQGHGPSLRRRREGVRRHLRERPGRAAHRLPVPPRQPSRRDRGGHGRPLRAGAGMVHLRRGRPHVPLRRERRRAQDPHPAPDPVGDRRGHLRPRRLRDPAVGDRHRDQPR